MPTKGFKISTDLTPVLGKNLSLLASTSRLRHEEPTCFYIRYLEVVHKEMSMKIVSMVGVQGRN
jgi:hypothetical protein